MLATLTHLAAMPALLPSWMNPDHLLNSLGDWALWGGAAIIFAECGLLIGFFLPGDSLLFTVGMLTTSNVISQPLWLSCVVLTIAAIAGNIVGYEIGRAAGPAIFNKPDSRLFKREYADKTTAFFDKYGARAIILARFVPIVRTFITVMAGVGKMERRRYFLYSGIGGVLWATGVTLLGSVLGKFSFVRNNLEPMIILIVLLSIIPMVIEYQRERRRTSGVRRKWPEPVSDVPRPAAQLNVAVDRQVWRAPRAGGPTTPRWRERSRARAFGLRRSRRPGCVTAGQSRRSRQEAPPCPQRDQREAHAKFRPPPPVRSPPR